MPIHTQHFTLSNVTATKVCSADSQPQQIWVHNSEHSHSDQVFIGNATVTTANGLHIHSDETLQIELDPGSELWAISDTNGSLFQVMCIKQD